MAEGAPEGALRIRAAFAEAGRPLFMPYLMGGFPDLASSAAQLAAAGRHSDVIELGIPFSDPLADGPVIQAAGQRALELDAELVVVCLSGRGDKDLAQVT